MAASSSDPGPTVLYVGASLPQLSETFVWREVLGLRHQGTNVRVASVHLPGRALGDPRLEDLAAEAIPVYGAGASELLIDAALEACSRPARALRTLGLAVRDSVLSSDVSLGRRPRVVWQSLAGLALARRARPAGVDHVHAHMAHVPTTIAMYAARQLGVPFSFTGHANDLFQARTLLREKLERATFVACISEWHRRFYQGVTPDLAEARAPIVRCGVELPGSDGGARPAEALILAVARLVEKKGLDLLVEATRLLGERGVRPRVLIVGDGPERLALTRQIAAAGLEEQVELAGPLPNHVVREHLAAATIVALPCRIDRAGDRDGIPVALIEAMAAETPVVAGDLPTVRELIEHEVTGLLVPRDDPAALAGALARLLADRQLRERLARAGARRVAEEFSLDANLARLRGALLRAAGRTPRLPARPRPYLLVTPCRDEAGFIERTIASVVAQTCPPAEWIIVDDGSTDGTPEVLARAAARHAFIKVVRRPDRGRRSVGPGVVEAFYYGLAHTDLDRFEFLCKLDGDLELPPRYFERLLEHMEAEPRLGNISGTTWVREPDGRVTSERQGIENAIGAAKFYRVRCFRDIGGFVRTLGWDGIDGHMCRSKGWIARAADEPDLRIVHQRRMGSSVGSLWEGRRRWGRIKWTMGSRPWFVAAASIYRLFEPPYVVGGVGIAVGYVEALLTGAPRLSDPALVDEVRRFERTALLRGKGAALRRRTPPGDRAAGPVLAS